MACRSSFTRLASPIFGFHPHTPHLVSSVSLRSSLYSFKRSGVASLSTSASNVTPVPSSSSSNLTSKENLLRDRPPMVLPEEPTSTPSGSTSKSTIFSSDSSSPQIAARPPKPPKVERPKPRLVGRKAALTLTPGAVARLQALLTGPHPQLIRIGVRNKGCAGMSYHLEYVDKPGMFDEIVEQDGVRVLIDSKALFSIIGSEMDWVEDRMSAKFAFRNPNVKDACGCGESFSLGPMQS